MPSLPSGVSKDTIRAVFEAVSGPSATSRLPSSAASVNATLVKASPGSVNTISGVNAAATVMYLKLYNKASAPTVGTDTPFATLALPALSAFNLNLSGLQFSAGIGFGLTTGAADNSSAAVASGDILGLTITYA